MVVDHGFGLLLILTTQKIREVDAGFLGSFNLLLPGQGCCRHHAQG